MELEFIGRNTEITAQQRAIARKKFQRLDKYFNAVHEARVTLSHEKHRVAVEAFIHGKDFEVAAFAETGDWPSSLQEVVGKLEEQARRMKQRLTGRKRQREKEPASPQEEPVAVPEAESGTRRRGEPQVVETRTVPVLPMTVAEAALQLESSADDFIVFREAESDKIHVLYRRRDRAFGLVAPEF
jgi:putative sigma-54 modulation protein